MPSSSQKRIVMKFGGTSMAGSERIRHVAGLVKREAERGNQVAVVIIVVAATPARQCGKHAHHGVPHSNSQLDRVHRPSPAVP
jgi:uridylate kinase